MIETMLVPSPPPYIVIAPYKIFLFLLKEAEWLCNIVLNIVLDQLWVNIRFVFTKVNIELNVKHEHWTRTNLSDSSQFDRWQRTFNTFTFFDKLGDGATLCHKMVISTWLAPFQFFSSCPFLPFLPLKFFFGNFEGKILNTSNIKNLVMVMDQTSVE